MPAVDIELTNACNTACIFCPREKTPDQGFINQKTFEKAVDRVMELDAPPEMKFCGLGEPLMHPDVAQFAGYLADRGIPPTISSNAWLLTESMAESLLNAGVRQMCLSVSGIYEIYEQIHKLKFPVILENITRFLKLAQGRCQIKLSIVRCHENRAAIPSIKSFWKDRGIEQIVVYDYVNRSGNLDLGYQFSESNRLYPEAEAVLKKNRLHPVCMAPLVFNFIGWNGNHYLCSNEYAKRLPLGTVFEYSLEEIKQIKIQRMLEGADVCRRCDLNVINRIREVLFRMESGRAHEADLLKEIEEIRQIQETGAVLYDGASYFENQAETAG